jgi:hypothetical protein
MKAFFAILLIALLAVGCDEGAILNSPQDLLDGSSSEVARGMRSVLFNFMITQPSEAFPTPEEGLGRGLRHDPVYEAVFYSTGLDSLNTIQLTGFWTWEKLNGKLPIRLGSAIEDDFNVTAYGLGCEPGTGWMGYTGIRVSSKSGSHVQLSDPETLFALPLDADFDTQPSSCNSAFEHGDATVGFTFVDYDTTFSTE